MQLKLVKRVIGDPKEFYKLVGNYEKRMGKYTSAKYGLSRLPTVNMLDIFPDLDITIKNYTYLTGTSMVTDIALLSLLAKSKPDCDYMEIGSRRGESNTMCAIYSPKQYKSYNLESPAKPDKTFTVNIKAERI